MVAKILVKALIRLHCNPVYGFGLSIFRIMEVILCWLEVRFPGYKRKHLFAAFEIVFNAFAILFFETLVVILHRLELLLKRYRQKSLFTGFKMTFPVLFLELWSLNRAVWSYGFKDTGEKIYSPLWNLVCLISLSIFRTLEVILWFLEVRLSRYQKNVYSLALKYVLRHLQYYFLNIGGYFASIGNTVAKIRAKTVIHQL